ncbi:ribosome-inactivating family protein [Actinoplanes teichomyceticus]|uniref:ribosome-inactivating family protein n=1 Tax=Actinoplanes teichomyceticus TaxID=1867 RepID=UPI0013DE3F45|nr:ribosome-inactivating family protein [Actinoplanes teichomyceticus]
MLALVSAIAALAVSPTPASADVSGNFYNITWNIDNLRWGGAEAATDYYNMIAAVHRAAGHDYQSESNVDETTSQGAQLIGINIVLDGDHIATVYLWSNILYVAGFWSQRTNIHYEFSTYSDVFRQRIRSVAPGAVFSNIGTGSYTNLNGGSQQARASRVFTPEGMYNSILGLYDPGSRTLQQRQQSYVDAIQYISEAARFGLILNRVYDNLLHYTTTPIGADYAQLENDWDRVSTFIHRVTRGDVPSNYTITVLGQTFRTLAALMFSLRYVMINYGSGR